MADSKFNNKVVGENTGYSFKKSTASTDGSNLGVDRQTLERGTQAPKKFSVDVDGIFDRLPKGRDRA